MKADCACRVCGKPFRPRSGKKNLYCSRACYGLSSRVDHVAAFWAKVNRSDECWLWTGSVFKQTGYGACWDGTRVTTAHRASYAISVGPIPDGLHVLHRCDNRRCVRPDHLFAGTNLENIRDRMSKGRKGGSSGLHGESHPRAKLTAAKVRKARSLRQAGWTLERIGHRFGMSKPGIAAAIAGRTWRHI